MTCPRSLATALILAFSLLWLLACESSETGSRDQRDGRGGQGGEPTNEDPGSGGEPPSKDDPSGDGGKNPGSAGSSQGDPDEMSGTGGQPEERERSYLPCDVEVIIENHCRVCHTPEGNDQEPYFSTFAQVRLEAETILDVIADDYMPYVGAPLTDTQKATLQSWVDDGTPSVVSTTPPDCTEP